jgi:hypothetical protein
VGAGGGGGEVPPEGLVPGEEEEGSGIVVVAAAAACEPAASISCHRVGRKNEEPWIDGWSDEWGNVEAFEVPLVRRIDSRPYPRGNGAATVQCMHDADKIHLLYHVPGPYRFSPRDNRLCAAMSTMFRMGDMAMLSDMVGRQPNVSYARLCIFIRMNSLG